MNHLAMPRQFRRWLVLALNLTLISASLGMPARTLAQGTPEATACATASGVLILQERAALGANKTGLVVVDPATGQETGRIAIPAVQSLFPTKLPGRALAVAASRLYLIDAGQFRATDLALDNPATGLTPNPVQFRGSAGRRYLLLGSPSFDLVLLIDAETATATDLTALIAPPAPGTPVFIQNAVITPDDEHVVLWDGRHIYVTSTVAPTQARRVDRGAFAFSPAFSPDGKELIFSESTGPGSGSTLIHESIDGAQRQVLRESEFAQVTLWVPESQTILIDERAETGAAAGVVSLYDLETKTSTGLLRYEGSLTTVQMSVDGHFALLGIQQAGNATWHRADLVAATVATAPQLGSGLALPGLYGNARWSLFVPLDAASGPFSGPAIKSIDLETGAVARLLDLDPNWPITRQPLLSPSGRFALITGATSTREKLWLLDAKEIRTTELAEAKAVSALFSPDSCFVAITTKTSLDGLPVSSTAVVAVSIDSPRVIENGQALAWLEAG